MHRRSPEIPVFVGSHVTRDIDSRTLAGLGVGRGLVAGYLEAMAVLSDTLGMDDRRLGLDSWQDRLRDGVPKLQMGQHI